MKSITFHSGAALFAAATLFLARPAAAAFDDVDDPVKSMTVRADNDEFQKERENEHKVLVRSVERTHGVKKEVAWLGVAVMETSDDLQAQLGLKAGEGLVVTMVVTNSPAQKVELRKHDVLVAFDGQMLVDPEQLRKLVQMHAEGDEIKLTYYRAGKKETVTAKLAKTTWDDAALEGDGVFQGVKLDLAGLQNLAPQLQGHLRAAARSLDGEKAELEALKEAMAEKGRATVDMKRAMEEARRAIERAVRDYHGHGNAFGSTDKDMQALAEGDVDLDKDATVVVQKDSKSARSIVKTDDSGDYVIIADPKKRLTAHDHDGKLLFDGAIETSEEQAKVPKDVWEKVKPMIEQIGTFKDGKPQSRMTLIKSNS